MTLRIEIYEPWSPHRCSGGFRYQSEVGQRLQKWGIGGLRGISNPGELALDALPPGTVILLDGLFSIDTIQHFRKHAPVPLGLFVHWLAPQAPDLSASERSRRWDELSIKLGLVDLVISSAESLLDSIDSLIPRSVTRAVAVPGTVPLAPWSGRTDGPIVAVGAVTRAKGSAHIARALAKTSEASRPLQYLGPKDQDPDEVLAISNLAQSAGVPVAILGALSDTEVQARLHNASLYVSASRQESFGMANAEALSSGMPCVFTDTGDVAARWGRNAPNVDVVPIDNVEALAASIRRRLQPEACAVPPILPTWEETAEAIVDAVRRTAGRRS